MARRYSCCLGLAVHGKGPMTARPTPERFLEGATWRHDGPEQRRSTGCLVRTQKNRRGAVIGRRWQENSAKPRQEKEGGGGGG